MTARLILESCLIELTKLHAPSMRLDEFNYYINKAVNLYINKRYNIYDINQLTTDDLRVLKATAVLTPKSSDIYTTAGITESLSDALYANAKNPYGAVFEVNLPDDYLHMLNCICIFTLTKQFKCWDSNSDVAFAAKRLTSDSWSTIMNDFYNRPLPWRPYYYIHNVNKSEEVPTNTYAAPTAKGLGTGTDGTTALDTTDGVANFTRSIKIGEVTQSVVEKNAPFRYGNTSTVRCEIRYGHDTSVFKLTKVAVDYIKAPQYIRLTQELMDLTEDTSQIMEFPDYVCQEIINELVHLVMEHDGDPRLQSNIPISQSIALPAQQLELPQLARK